MSEHEPTRLTSSSPGQILRAGREAKSRSVVEVAQKLRLRVEVIRDIESDNFGQVAAPVYIRGYLRSYARLVDLPEEQVLAAYEEIAPEVEQIFARPAAAFPAQDMPVYMQSNNTPRQRRVIRWISGLIIGALIMLVAVWWRGQSHNDAQPDSVLSQSQLQMLPTKPAEAVGGSSNSMPENAFLKQDKVNIASNKQAAESTTPAKPTKNEKPKATPKRKKHSKKFKADYKIVPVKKS